MATRPDEPNEERARAIECKRPVTAAEEYDQRTPTVHDDAPDAPAPPAPPAPPDRPPERPRREVEPPSVELEGEWDGSGSCEVGRGG